MKKLLLSMAIVATGFAAFAQKPTAGNITTEVGMTSLLGTPAVSGTQNIPVGMFRVRYFLDEGMAVRVNLSLGMTTTTTKYDNAAPPVAATVSGESKVSTTSFGLGLGVEKHLEGTSSLSPYLGAEFGFSTVSSSTDATNSVNGTTVGASGDAFKRTGGGTTTLALNGLVGADYYLTEKVYFGAEMGIGLFMSSSTADRETSVTTGGNTTKATTLGTSTSGFGLMPSVLGQIRLGIILM